MMVAMTSLTVQLGWKLFENVVLGFITSGMIKIYRKCKRQKNDDDKIHLEIVTSAQGSSVCHLHANCGHVKRMSTANRKFWRTCDDCLKYLDKETDKALQARMDEEV